MDALAFEPYTFEDGLQISLRKRYPDADISIFDVSKNNGVKLRALTIKKQNSNITPTIYIDGFMQRYERTHDMDEICEKIVEINENRSVENLDINMLRCFDNAKERICAKLINREKNTEMLAEIPHRDFLDLAVVYYISIEVCDGTASLLIHNGLVESWNVDEEELYNIAIKNMPKLLPVGVKSLFQVVSGMVDDTDVDIDEAIQGISESMYVVTNEMKTFGAAVLLYPGFLKQMADHVQSSFYIIPSSIHEVIVVLDTDELTDAEGLLEMVKHVNESVATEELLADNVYYYDRESDKIKALF